MARTGFTTSILLRCASAPVTAAPLTLSIWFNVTSTISQTLIGVYNSATANAFNSFEVYIINTTGKLRAGISDAAAGNYSESVAAVTTNVWNHCLAVYASSTSRTIYLNGVAGATDTVSRIPSGVNRVSIGAEDSTTVQIPMSGPAAEGAIWNVALSAADALALSKGMSAMLMHPEALKGYWPLMGRNSPEPNLKSNAATMALVGAPTQSAHPRIYMPPKRKVLPI